MKRMSMSLITVIAVFTLVACGREGPSYSASVEHDGVTVDLETWYFPPGLTERIYAGADGISLRISIGGKTATMSGNYFPTEWEEAEHTNPFNHSPLFWKAVAEKFNAVVTPEGHKGEHKWLYRELLRLGDGPVEAGD